jgi:prepilin-type N-terminal cleavage/methylation domain-containing protein
VTGAHRRGRRWIGRKSRPAHVRRWRKGRDGGFTLIEMMLALSLIALIIVPLTSVFWSSLRTESVSGARGNASAIASREIEGIHAVTYASIGFYSDQSFPSAWNTWVSSHSYTTVTLGSCSTTCSSGSFTPLIQPTGTSTVAGITYSISRYIYWQTATGVNNGGTSTTFSSAYKGVTVTVSWTDKAGTHIVQQNSIEYPGGQGPYSTASTTTTTAPLSPPGAPTLTATGTPTSNEIDFTITAPTSGGQPSNYIVQYSTDPTFSTYAQSAPLPGTSTGYQVTTLAASTKYYFQIEATNSAGASPWSASVPPFVSTASSTTTTSTTVAATTTTTVASTTTTTLACSLNGFTITTTRTGKTYETAQGNMSENVSLIVQVSGNCTGVVTVQSVLHGTTTADPSSPYPLSGPASGGQWSGTILSNGQSGWSVGTHDMTVYLNGVATTLVHSLLVCAHVGNGQQNNNPGTC